MRLVVNGEPTEIPEGETVAWILDRLQIVDPRGVAVAVDGEVVPRSGWAEESLSEGQRVEVVRAVQGG